MLTNLSFTGRRAAWFIGTTVVSVLLSAGCVYENPHRGVVYQEPPRVVVLVQDDYVYYPQYEIYYSNSRHQYGYRDGHAWAWRPAPPHVEVNVLYASPSVRMDFHDSPEQHHSRVVQTYPRNWKQPEKHRGDKDDHHDNRQH